jgi:hypothetical protein
LALELLNIAPLLLELSVLSIDLPLLLVCSVFETLELISDQPATQSTHSAADRRARAWCAHCRTDNRTARRPQAAAHKSPFSRVLSGCAQALSTDSKASAPIQFWTLCYTFIQVVPPLLPSGRKLAVPEEHAPSLRVLSDLNHLLKPLPVPFGPDAVGPCWEFGKKPGAVGDGFNSSPTLGVSNQDFDIAEVIAFGQREAEMQVIFLSHGAERFPFIKPNAAA